MFFFKKKKKTRDEIMLEVAERIAREHEKKGPVHVDLWAMVGTGIIVPYPSGIFFTNQVGGRSCDHPTQEGFFVPLSTGGEGQNTSNTCPLTSELSEHFYDGPKWSGHCYSGIDAETADYLDTLFQKYWQTKYLRVNREMLNYAKEAWIHVTLHYPEKEFRFISGIDPKNAILTWPNSD